MLFSNTLKFYVSLIILLLSSAVYIQAQDATAASLYNDGFALIKSKDYEGGLALLEQALMKAEEEGKEDVADLSKKNGAVAAINVGNAKRKAKMYEEAMTFYTKAIALNPDNSSIYEGMARTEEAQGKKVEAVASYAKAAQMAVAEEKPKRSESRYKKAATMIGKTYVAKDYDTAIAAGEAFIAVNDKNADVHYYVSKSLAEKGDNDKAISHIEKAVMLAGDNVPAKFLYAQGEQYENLGKKTEAIAAYGKITDAKYKTQADYRISELQK